MKEKINQTAGRLKQTVRAVGVGIATLTASFFMSAPAYAAGVQDSQIVKGTEKLVGDVTTWLMVLAPVVASEEEESKEGLFQSADYLGTLLRIAQAPKAPPSFFSWTEPSTGVTAYPSAAWSKSGYTVFFWVRIENFATESSLLPLLCCACGVTTSCTMNGVNPQQIDIALRGSDLVVRLTNEKNDVSTVTVPMALQKGKWYRLGVTQAKKGLWKSALSVYLDGSCIFDEKFPYPENFDNGGKSNYAVYFARSFATASYSSSETE